jgi:hypothetical protein
LQKRLKQKILHKKLLKRNQKSGFANCEKNKANNLRNACLNFFLAAAQFGFGAKSYEPAPSFGPKQKESVIGLVKLLF